ncbi:hypothetical protein, partial [Streptomyces sp. NPDC056188]|uniref:hypothetical protein n=1 Tax=Streptomyces sp. NPDC056188 TaxID=3345740 RepID=UPI0035DE4CF1
DRKAEGRPRTGCTWAIPTTQRACVPGVAGQTPLSKHALGAADLGSQAEGNRVNVAAAIQAAKARLKEVTNYIEDLDE